MSIIDKGSTFLIQYLTERYNNDIDSEVESFPLDSDEEREEVRIHEEQAKEREFIIEKERKIAEKKAKAYAKKHKKPYKNTVKINIEEEKKEEIPIIKEIPIKSETELIKEQVDALTIEIEKLQKISDDCSLTKTKLSQVKRVLGRLISKRANLLDSLT